MNLINENYNLSSLPMVSIATSKGTLKGFKSPVYKFMCSPNWNLTYFDQYGNNWNTASYVLDVYVQFIANPTNGEETFAPFPNDTVSWHNVKDGSLQQSVLYTEQQELINEVLVNPVQATGMWYSDSITDRKYDDVFDIPSIVELNPHSIVAAKGITTPAHTAVDGKYSLFYAGAINTLTGYPINYDNLYDSQKLYSPYKNVITSGQTPAVVNVKSYDTFFNDTKVYVPSSQVLYYFYYGVFHQQAYTTYQYAGWHMAKLAFGYRHVGGGPE